jgi:hypothetical protein
MKVADIDRFLDRWRATLPPAFAPEYVDGFMRRHRGELHALVLKTLARRGAEGGEAPELLADFLAYDAVAAAQRIVDAQPDPQVMRELMRHVDAQFAQGHNELSVFHNFAVEYIDARTEAIFLRDAGWDVVPLLLERPALAIIAGGHVIAVRDWRGWLKIHPERRGTLNHLFADVDRAEEKLLRLRDELDLERDTKERLMKYATATWKHARKACLNLPPPAAPNATRAKKRG